MPNFDEWFQRATGNFPFGSFTSWTGAPSKTYLEPLLGTGWLAMTIPDKPRSPKQRYRTTDLGLTVLSQRRRGE